MHLVTFPDYLAAGEALAAELGLPASAVELHRFPDGESRLRLPPPAPEPLILCRSLDRPNDKLIELLMAARTAREAGAGPLTLVAPYLCYMRQDAAFHPGESVSQRVIGEFLADLFDTVITVDPHLHRVRDLAEAVPAHRAVAVSAAEPLRDHIGRHWPGAVVVGPDAESEQWVRKVAEPAGLDWAVGAKDRRGDRDVTITLPPTELDGRDVVLLDDVASSGLTLARAAEAAFAAGAARVDAVVTHALFAEGAEAAIAAAGVGTVHSTNSIAHPTNAVPLAPLLAAAVRGDESPVNSSSQ